MYNKVDKVILKATNDFYAINIPLSVSWELFTSVVIRNGTNIEEYMIKSHAVVDKAK
jgi:hypothetical protein